MSGTTDGLSERTRERVRQLAAEGEDIDDVVNRVLDERDHEGEKGEEGYRTDEQADRVREQHREYEEESQERMKQLENRDN